MSKLYIDMYVCVLFNLTLTTTVISFTDQLAMLGYLCYPKTCAWITHPNQVDLQYIWDIFTSTVIRVGFAPVAGACVCVYMCPRPPHPTGPRPGLL